MMINFNGLVVLHKNAVLLLGWGDWAWINFVMFQCARAMHWLSPARTWEFELKLLALIILNKSVDQLMNCNSSNEVSKSKEWEVKRQMEEDKCRNLNYVDKCGCNSSRLGWTCRNNRILDQWFDQELVDGDELIVLPTNFRVRIFSVHIFGRIKWFIVILERLMTKSDWEISIQFLICQLLIW